MLFEGLQYCQHLVSLDLRSSLLSTAAAEQLAYFLRLDRLTELSLADCLLGELAAPVLDAVAVCRRLTKLNLRVNAMSGHIAVQLCQTLDASVSLTEVDLTSNDLDDDFGVTFAAVLGSNKILRKVDLSRNPLTMRTGEALLRTLQRKNATLTSIGDAVRHLPDLGARQSLQIQRLLAANAQGSELAGPLKERDKDRMGLGLEDIEWQILEDEPQLFEPMLSLLC